LQSPLEQFAIKPLIPLHLGDYDISFTQSSLWMVVGVVLTTLLMTLSIRGKSLVPGRWQNICEMLYETISGLVDENLSGEGRKYFPFIFTLFMVVLMGNVLGLLPYAFTYTSHIIVTGALAVFVFAMTLVVGIAKHKLHFFSQFLPPGVPFFMVPLIIPIEIISFLSRPISLSVRLRRFLRLAHFPRLRPQDVRPRHHQHQYTADGAGVPGRLHSGLRLHRPDMHLS
jgi:F-type H+-transporting ATPase subunit a